MTVKRISLLILGFLLVAATVAVIRSRTRSAEVREAVRAFVVSLHEDTQLSRDLWPEERADERASTGSMITSEFEIVNFETYAGGTVYEFAVQFRNGRTGIVYATTEEGRLISAEVRLNP